MIKQLTDYYTPNHLLFRESQIEEIEKCIKNFIKFKVGANKILVGASGTGKTATIKHLMNKNDNCIYISASDEKTSNRILRQICPKKIKTIDKVIKNLKQELTDNPKVLIIDEINKVNRIHELFDDLNTIYRETQVPIILITNRRDLIEKMPDDAKKTLFFSRVEFFPYDAIQLKEIVKDRLNLIPEDLVKSIPEGFLEYICARANQEGGSARIALDMTMRSIMEQNFTYEFIDKFLLEKQKSDFETWYKNLTNLEKKFTNAIVNLQTDETTITPSEIQKYLDGRSPSQISNLITQFEDYGIISTHYLNRGKSGGRLRVIEMTPEIHSKLLGVIA